MIKWFVYIALLLIFTTYLSSAASKNFQLPVPDRSRRPSPSEQRFAAPDTSRPKQLKQQDVSDSKKIKEVARAKRQSKPEKIDEQQQQPTTPNNTTPPAPVKPKRQRRPAGMERPPEIPRRNN